MPQRIDRALSRQRGKQCGNRRGSDGKHWGRMIRGLGHQKVVAAGNGILAAIVGFRSGSAFALEAAIHCFVIATSTGQAVERPDQQYKRQEADEDVNAPRHFCLHRNTNSGLTILQTDSQSFIPNVIGTKMISPSNPCAQAAPFLPYCAPMRSLSIAL
jgi:hypothetical protein